MFGVGGAWQSPDTWFHRSPVRLQEVSPISPEILSEYLRRSYHAVDGLWFMMVEEELGFDRALGLDERVWRVLAKIQARKARELLQCAGNEPQDLLRCFSLKLTADGHQFDARVEEDRVNFRIAQCPWQDLLSRSDRQHLAALVSRRICPAEGETWCREFGGEYAFEMPCMMCDGAGDCAMIFRRR